MDKNFSKCPMCPTGELQSTFVYIDNETLKAHGCNKCKYGFWEPQVDTQTYSVSTTGRTSYEDQLAKEIAEMSDEEVGRNVKKFFYNPLEADDDFEPPKPKSKITQALVDNIFSCLDGYGLITYARDECELIQKTLKQRWGVHLSISECQRFWSWRSEQWDSSFLGTKDPEEITEWFQKWLDEQDLWEYNE